MAREKKEEFPMILSFQFESHLLTDMYRKMLSQPEFCNKTNALVNEYNENISRLSEVLCSAVEANDGYVDAFKEYEDNDEIPEEQTFIGQYNFEDKEGLMRLQAEIVRADLANQDNRNIRANLQDSRIQLIYRRMDSIERILMHLDPETGYLTKLVPLEGHNDKVRVDAADLKFVDNNKIDVPLIDKTINLLDKKIQAGRKILEEIQRSNDPRLATNKYILDKILPKMEDTRYQLEDAKNKTGNIDNSGTVSGLLTNIATINRIIKVYNNKDYLGKIKECKELEVIKYPVNNEEIFAKQFNYGTDIPEEGQEVKYDIISVKGGNIGLEKANQIVKESKKEIKALYDKLGIKPAEFKDNNKTWNIITSVINRSKIGSLDKVVTDLETLINIDGKDFDSNFKKELLGRLGKRDEVFLQKFGVNVEEFYKKDNIHKIAQDLIDKAQPKDKVAMIVKLISILESESTTRKVKDEIGYNIAKELRKQQVEILFNDLSIDQKKFESNYTNAQDIINLKLRQAKDLKTIDNLRHLVNAYGNKFAINFKNQFATNVDKKERELVQRISMVSSINIDSNADNASINAVGNNVSHKELEQEAKKVSDKDIQKIHEKLGLFENNFKNGDTAEYIKNIINNSKENEKQDNINNLRELVNYNETHFGPEKTEQLLQLLNKYEKADNQQQNRQVAGVQIGRIPDDIFDDDIQNIYEKLGLFENNFKNENTAECIKGVIAFNNEIGKQDKISYLRALVYYNRTHFGPEKTEQLFQLLNEYEKADNQQQNRQVVGVQNVADMDLTQEEYIGKLCENEVFYVNQKPVNMDGIKKWVLSHKNLDNARVYATFMTSKTVFENLSYVISLYENKKAVNRENELEGTLSDLFISGLTTAKNEISNKNYSAIANSLGVTEGELKGKLTRRIDSIIYDFETNGKEDFEKFITLHGLDDELLNEPGNYIKCLFAQNSAKRYMERVEQNANANNNVANPLPDRGRRVAGSEQQRVMSKSFNGRFDFAAALADNRGKKENIALDVLQQEQVDVSQINNNIGVNANGVYINEDNLDKMLMSTFLTKEVMNKIMKNKEGDDAVDLLITTGPLKLPNGKIIKWPNVLVKGQNGKAYYLQNKYYLFAKNDAMLRELNIDYDELKNSDAYKNKLINYSGSKQNVLIELDKEAKEIKRIANDKDVDITNYTKNVEEEEFRATKGFRTYEEFDSVGISNIIDVIRNVADVKNDSGYKNVNKSVTEKSDWDTIRNAILSNGEGDLRSSRVALSLNQNNNQNSRKSSFEQRERQRNSVSRNDH